MSSRTDFFVVDLTSLLVFLPSLAFPLLSSSQSDNFFRNSNKELRDENLFLAIRF